MEKIKTWFRKHKLAAALAGVAAVLGVINSALDIPPKIQKYLHWNVGSASQSIIKIESAIYGKYDFSIRSFQRGVEVVCYDKTSIANVCDFTEIFRSNCDGKLRCEVGFGNHLCADEVADPAVGCKKTLVAEYSCMVDGEATKQESLINGEHDGDAVLVCASK